MDGGAILVLVLNILFLLSGVIWYAKLKIWDEPHKEIARLKDDLSYKDKQLKEMQSKLEDQHARIAHLFRLYPELKTDDFVELCCDETTVPRHRICSLLETLEQLEVRGESANTFDKLFYEIIPLKSYNKFLLNYIAASRSNLEAIPYMAGVMADFETYSLEILAKSLEWGCSRERARKVAAIRDLRRASKDMIEKNKEAQYQLAYLLEMFPNLKDVIESEFAQLPIIDVSTIEDYDKSRDFLSKEEYASLSQVERNQLALDRYKHSHRKTKWQIGRDYELYVGYKYSQKGYAVDYFGSYMGIEDLGRDLICTRGEKTLLVQCKYWSSIKQIHEKHITQLFGTVASYCVEHDLDISNVQGILVTNITLSEMAKRMANYLGISFVENFEVGDYPCIKCNIGRGEYGESTKIYHLPFDQQYDSTKIQKSGEFFAMTVAEAENAGFRRACKWFGS